MWSSGLYDAVVMIESAPDSLECSRTAPGFPVGAIFMEVSMAKEKVNVYPQEGPGRHSGKKHPKTEAVKDAKHNPQPKATAIGDFRASTGTEK
jgi:hypothetical protein